MKIYSWNVNGIRAIQKKGFIEWVLTEKPDILCLQETKAEISQLEDDLIHIPGYHSCFSSAVRKGYSGVAVYSKIEPQNIETSIGVENFDSEGRVLICTFEHFTLLNIYFPNGQRDDERLAYKMKFYARVLELCNQLLAKGDKLVICGDYNTAHNEIDLKNPKANSKRSGFLPEERAWLDSFVKNGYVDTFRELYPDKIEYSWWSYRFNARANNAGWRIDYHFVSKNLFDRVKDAEILTKVKGSDHCPVVVELHI